jgi:hypothetical protein
MSSASVVVEGSLGKCHTKLHRSWRELCLKVQEQKAAIDSSQPLGPSSSTQCYDIQNHGQYHDKSYQDEGHSWDKGW